MSVIKFKKSKSNKKIQISKSNTSLLTTHNKRKGKGYKTCDSRESTYKTKSESVNSQRDKMYRFKSNRTKKHFRELLITERKKRGEHMNQLHQTSASTTVSHNSEGVIQCCQIAINAESCVLHDINEALRKLYKGGFGVCVQCNKFIGRARLEVLPYARYCFVCQSKKEKRLRSISSANLNAGLATEQLLQEEAQT